MTSLCGEWVAKPLDVSWHFSLLHGFPIWFRTFLWHFPQFPAPSSWRHQAAVLARAQCSRPGRSSRRVSARPGSPQDSLCGISHTQCLAMAQNGTSVFPNFGEFLSNLPFRERVSVCYLLFGSPASIWAISLENLRFDAAFALNRTKKHHIPKRHIAPPHHPWIPKIPWIHCLEEDCKHMGPNLWQYDANCNGCGGALMQAHTCVRRGILFSSVLQLLVKFFFVVLILILNSFQAKPYGLISFSSLMVGISNGWDWRKSNAQWGIEIRCVKNNVVRWCQMCIW